MSYLCAMYRFLRYSQFEYPSFDDAMVPPSDDVLEMSGNSKHELTVLWSMIFSKKDEPSCCVFNCSASPSTSGLVFRGFL